MEPPTSTNRDKRMAWDLSKFRGTVFSSCRKWRYTLWRSWAEDLMQKGMSFTEDPHPDYYPGTPESYVQFLCLNPSTADETLDDPTVAKCVRYAKRWGFGGFCMTNIFAWRATDPDDMKRQPEPIGVKNDLWIHTVAQSAGLVVAAWGNHGTHNDRATHVLAAMKRSGIVLHCLNKNLDGSPVHPLYQKDSNNPILL